MTKKQLLDHQPGFDGLTEAHIVGEEEVGSGAGEGALERGELVGLDVGAAAERRLDGVIVSAGDRTPTQGVNEGRELVGIIEPGGVDLVRKTTVGQCTAALLKLPHDPELVAEPVLLHRLEGDCVLELRAGVVSSAASKPLLLDVDDSPVGSSHGHDLSNFGHGSAWNHNFSHLSDPR